jgi:hypothetical protein
MNSDDCAAYLKPVIARMKVEFEETASLGREHVAAQWLEQQIGHQIYTEFCSRRPDEDFPLPDIWRELFTAMNSPHWRTVLRVWQIKHGVTPCQE